MRIILAFFIIILLVFNLQSSVLAFSDIQGMDEEKEILELKEQGIIQGVTEKTFAPMTQLTYAQGVALIVRAFDLNLAHFMFIKEPVASDYFTNVTDNQWYSTAFTHAFLNEINIDKEILPETKLTKEQFVDLVYQAMVIKNDMAFIEIWMNIDDENDVSTQYVNSIQKMIITDITPLNNGKYYPQKVLTREEGAMILHRALQFVSNYNLQNSDNHNR